MNDDKLKAAEELARRILRRGLGAEVNAFDIAAAKDVLPEQELPEVEFKRARLTETGEPVIIACWGNRRGGYVTWKRDAAGKTWAIGTRRDDELRDIQPLHPPNPPAPRELMERVEMFLKCQRPPTRTNEDKRNQLLAAVRQHCDPELPAKLRKIAEISSPDWMRHTLRQLAAELEGK